MFKNLLFALCLFFFSCKEGSAQSSLNLTTSEFQELAKASNATILDVRTLGEWNSGYIPKAIHMNFYEEKFQSQLEEIPKENTVLVYCASGGRSSKTLQILKEKGFSKAYHLRGGIRIWQEKGLPIVH